MPFDIVFCDMMMPGMNGIEVLSGLQKSHKDLPVVIMTGHSRAKYEHEAMMLGAFAFLTQAFRYRRDRGTDHAGPGTEGWRSPARQFPSKLQISASGLPHLEA